MPKLFGVIELSSRDLLDPGSVVGHPHVDTGQVRVGALDPVAHRSHQNPPMQEVNLTLVMMSIKLVMCPPYFIYLFIFY